MALRGVLKILSSGPSFVAFSCNLGKIFNSELQFLAYKTEKTCKAVVQLVYVNPFSTYGSPPCQAVLWEQRNKKCV